MRFPKTALLVIATGAKYRAYVDQLLESAKKYFVEHDVILWADGLIAADADFMLTKTALGYPGETLYRYGTLLGQEWLLKKYEYLFYVDVDMKFVAPVTEEEIFADGITAVQHPSYVGLSGTPETRTESMAWLPESVIRTYYAGGFIGGKTEDFLKMAWQISHGVWVDTAHGITAKYHDESHMNRYLYDHPPAKVLTPSFCYPGLPPHQYYLDVWKRAGVSYEPRLVALEKN
jgi:histo-blood group ABO system transferase